MVRFAPDSIEWSSNRKIKQERFSLACSMVKDEVIQPLMDILLDDIWYPSPVLTWRLHETKIEPTERFTDALFDLLQEEKDIDREEIVNLIRKSMQQEAEIIEQTEAELDKIFFYQVLALLKNILENAKDYREFIEIEDVYINTPHKLGKFVAWFLLSKKQHLPEKDFPIFRILENIITKAKEHNPREPKF